MRNGELLIKLVMGILESHMWKNEWNWTTLLRTTQKSTQSGLKTWTETWIQKLLEENISDKHLDISLGDSFEFKTKI